MQLIWNDQKDEMLYAIDEAALHAQIRRKGESVGRKVGFMEWSMIGVNIFVAFILLIDVIRDGGPTYQYFLAAIYFAYGVVALVRRLTRRKELVTFDHSLKGDLDKALWQVNYLIHHSRSVILWYLVPLLSVVAISSYLDDRSLWGLGLMILVIPAAYFATRWENGKFYLPKKRELEALRDTLLAAEE